jgi:hypothetical protein
MLEEEKDTDDDDSNYTCLFERGLDGGFHMGFIISVKDCASSLFCKKSAAQQAGPQMDSELFLGPSHHGHISIFSVRGK